MKSILLIGELNRTLENLHNCLKQDFQVQLSVANEESVKGKLKITRPDLIIIHLDGSREQEISVFEMLKQSKVNIPVLSIGMKEDCVLYEEYYEEERFEQLHRPILQGKLIEKCYQMTGVEKANKDNSKEEKESKKILVVDDSSLVLRNIKEMLEPEYKVFLSTSGRQALKFIPQKKPDLILLDYEMPGMDGKTTFEQIRKNDDIKDIPVIFLTGIADKEKAYAVLSIKPAGYILKPPVRERLIETIEKVLKSKED